MVQSQLTAQTVGHLEWIFVVPDRGSLNMGPCVLHMQAHAIAMRSLQAIKGLYVIGIHLSKLLSPPGVSEWICCYSNGSKFWLSSPAFDTEPEVLICRGGAPKSTA